MTHCSNYLKFMLEYFQNRILTDVNCTNNELNITGKT